MSKTVYIAAQYARRIEMQSVRVLLQSVGWEVTSRWLDGEEGMTLPDAAKMDVDDLLNADVCLSFTEPKGCGPTRGGRHVEFGIALQAGKRLVVVDHKENVFHYLPQVEFFPDLASALREVFCEVKL